MVITVNDSITQLALENIKTEQLKSTLCLLRQKQITEPRDSKQKNVNTEKNTTQQKEGDLKEWQRK